MSRARGVGPSMEGRCRSCGEAVLWAKHHATGKLAPLQLAPSGKPGNIAITDVGDYMLVEVGAGELVNHFAFCPASQEHRL